MVRKTWFDPASERPRSRLIEAGRFIVNDKVRNLTDAPRASEEIDLYPSEVRERINTGQFIEVELEYDDDDTSAPCLFIEQHCRLDLDEDGYTEPYIATIYEKNQELVRLVADFTEEDVKFTMGEGMQMAQVPMMGPQGPMMANMPQPVQVPTGIRSIRRNSYFTAYHFLPSLDGGFFGTGLGLLLGDISKSINSIINMLLDAGHYASLGGGFVGSDFRVKGGKTRFEPGEWKQVTAKGGDVRNSLVPMTFPGPDAVLFNMLSLLIDAGREIASVKDIMTGEQPRQNETATGTLARIEQGMMVFTAAYKRIFRGLKKEFKILARINAGTVTPEEYNAFHDPEPEQGPDGQPMPPQMFDPRADYSAADLDIEPVADPASVTKMQQMAKAQLVMDMAERGLADQGEAAMRIGEAASIPDMEELAPKPDPMAPMMQELQMTMMVTELKLKQADVMKREAEIQELQASVVEKLEGVELEKAKFQLDAFARGLAEERERLSQAMDGAMKQVQAMKAA
jgi:chaperonin GroES